MTETRLEVTFDGQEVGEALIAQLEKSRPEIAAAIRSLGHEIDLEVYADRGRVRATWKPSAAKP